MQPDFLFLTFNHQKLVSGLSKQKQKYIQSLHNKKYRKQFGEFLVEGEKSIGELLNSDFHISELFLSAKASLQIFASVSPVLCSEEEIEKVSTFRSNNFGVAVVKMREDISPVPGENPWVLALDEIHDPGNLGTIIRIADWYGIQQIVCSENTVDFYNPKVISSTMGSFTRVACHYVNLNSWLEEVSMPVYGAVLNGSDIHQLNDIEPGVLVIGSESHGLSPEIERLLNRKLTIPAFGRAESLNAGVAAGILLDNLKRISRA